MPSTSCSCYLFHSLSQTDKQSIHMLLTWLTQDIIALDFACICHILWVQQFCSQFVFLSLVCIAQVLAGSYFVVAGAVVSLVKPGRMSMFGTLLIVWGLLKETLLLKPDSIEGRKAGDNSIRLEPMLFVVLVLAVLSIRFDATKVQRLVRPVAKPLKSSAKIKVKWKMPRTKIVSSLHQLKHLGTSLKHG